MESGIGRAETQAKTARGRCTSEARLRLSLRMRQHQIRTRNKQCVRRAEQPPHSGAGVGRRAMSCMRGVRIHVAVRWRRHTFAAVSCEWCVCVTRLTWGRIRVELCVRGACVSTLAPSASWSVYIRSSHWNGSRALVATSGSHSCGQRRRKRPLLHDASRRESCSQRL